MASIMKSDAEYVDEVMSQSLLKPVSVVKEGENDVYSRKRALSGDDEGETSKKLKQQSPAEGICDLVDLMKSQFTSFRSDLQEMRSEMTSTFESRFTSFEAKLTNTVMKVVHEEIDSVKKDFNTRIDGLSNKLESKLESKLVQYVETHIEKKVSSVSDDLQKSLGLSELQKEVTSLKTTYASVAGAGASVPASSSSEGIERNIIIRNLRCDPKEETDRTVTLNKVYKLFRDSLKLKTVKIVSCERKSSKSKKPGVIVVTIETADQKQEIMQIKNRLKNTPEYKDVYIENDRSFSTRINESNMFTVLKELGKANDYFVSGSGRILKKTGKPSSRQ